MSILIKGIEMPKEPWECPCHNGENGRCNVTQKVCVEIPKDCPLVSVPPQQGIFENKTEEDKENNMSMIFDVKPIPPIRPLFGKDKQDRDLWDAIATAINTCGIYGEEVTMKGIETLKRLGRYDLLPPCER